VNALILNGVTVEVASAPFEIGGARYPAGSYVVRTQQAFRPQILDMFEPQDHPDDFAFPGAPPTPPYDTTGWTLAYQMGVGFDRILDGFDGPFERIDDVVAIPPGELVAPDRPAGFFLSHDTNDAFAAINRLLASGDEVFWLSQTATTRGRRYPEGTIYIRAAEGTRARLEQIASEVGVRFEGAEEEPGADALSLRPVRIGLWDEYGGSETSGWTRFVLESFGFAFEPVYAPRLDEGALGDDFDVLIFPDGAIPAADRRGGPTREPDGEIGETYGNRIGRVTISDTVPRLREFLDEGGTVLSVGSSTTLARHLELPVENAVAGLGDEEFYVPGSILRMRVDGDHPLSWGLAGEVDVFFDESPAFRITDGAEEAGLRPVATFGSEPLRSGWAWGEQALDGLAGVVDARVGSGRLLLYGPEVTFRSQSHGTFKLLFNGIYYGSAEPVRLGR
jgi:hypothetical protein